MNHREILRNALRQCLQEKRESFEGITDQIERSADLVRELGGLTAPEISSLDRAMISELIERQVQMGLARGDFDFVFRRLPAVKVPEFEIARLDLKADDSIVIKTPHELDPLHRDQLVHALRGAFGEQRRIVLLANGMDIALLAEGPRT